MLARVERTNHRKAFLLFSVHDASAFVFAGLRDRRFRTPEYRCHHHLILEHKKIDHEMMTVELKSPRVSFGRFTHEREPVLFIAILDEVVVDEFTQCVIQFHDVLGKCHAFGAQRSIEQVPGRCALIVVHLLQ